MRSMTGYSYIEDSYKNIQITIRSSNFKYLDISINSNLNQNILLEEKIKEEVKKLIKRGKIEIYIYFKDYIGDLKINKRILERYIYEIRDLANKYNLEYDLKLNNLLSLPGIIYREEVIKNYDDIIISLIMEGLKKLLDFKERTGEAIKSQMINDLKKISRNISEVKNIYKNNKKDLIIEEREDISEELSLIGFYIDTLNKKINSKKEILKGKTIDFLTQEILRELNTASSKIVDKDIASLVLESKIYTDRIREQAQNIE